MPGFSEMEGTGSLGAQVVKMRKGMSFDEIDYDSMDEDDIKLPANLLD